MLTETIHYTDTEGEAQTDVAYFNLTKAEAIELNIRQDLEVIGRSKDQNAIMDTFRKLMQQSYGVKTGDGKFVKRDSNGQPFFDSFATTEAYSELFMKLFGDSEYALEFIKAILPKDVAEALPGSQPAKSQSSIPDSLLNHPSMQGHKQGRRAAAPDSPSNPVLNDSTSAQPQTESGSKVLYTTPTFDSPEQLTEFEEFQAWRDQQAAMKEARTQQFRSEPLVAVQHDGTTTPPDRVSPPEAPQTDSSPRQDLV